MFELSDIPAPGVGPLQTTQPCVVVTLPNGDRYAVAPDYVPGVSISGAESIAKLHGFELPTPELVDAIFNLADVKIKPRPQTFFAYVQSAMDAPAIHKKQLDYVRSKTPEAFTLSAGGFKDVVCKNGRLGLYGWHLTAGKPIQKLYFKHIPEWCDYSQGARFVKKLP